ncbi:MAG: peptidoglycan binding protein CsiV [Gammaproteobacteria bacterium]|nr:peptidoglycan binding protein CsiV [Gammaproteobacteria bacterium]
MKKTNTSLLTLAGFLFAVSSYATDYTDLAAYEIEVIIFKFNNTESAGSEIWPDLVTTESVDNSIELHNNYSMTLTPGLDTPAYYYSKIPAENFRLVEEAGKLANSDAYEILYHTAWIQPGLDKEKAEFIHIKSLDTAQQLPTVDNLAVAPINSLVSSQMESILNPAQQQTEKNNLLDGVVKVELGRYLHIYFDLKYQRNLTEKHGVLNAGSINTYKELKYYPIQNHRRMRSKEVHYIDHPLVGIVVLATPFEAPKKLEKQPAQPLMKLNQMPVRH